MAILKVAHMGHPILREKARELTKKEILSDKVQNLIDDMIETMREYNGIGLAAPQVHESIQLCVVEIDSENPRYPDQEIFPVKVVINPVIKPVGKETSEMWEGCLSVPGLRGLVRRPSKVKVSGLDRKAKPFEWELDDLPATVIQHETDHLFGTLYVDRLVDTTKLVFQPEYQKYWLSGPDVEV